MSVKITWLSHAAFLIESDKYRLLIDPFLRGNPGAEMHPENIGKIDGIIITHGHGDHVGDTIDIARKTGALCISNVEICSWLRKNGVMKTHGQQPGGWFTHPFGRVRLTPAIHGSQLPDGTPGGIATGVVVEIEGKRIYHAGDTALFSDMKLIGDLGIDAALLPAGSNFTMDAEDLLLAADLLRPGLIIPMHYDTWDLIKADLSVLGSKNTSNHRFEIIQISSSVTL